MTTPIRTARIAAALVVTLAMLGVSPVIAQDFGGVGSKSIRAQREARRAQQQGKAKAAPEVRALYPDATRQPPGLEASRGNLKKLRKLQELYEAEDNAAAIALAEQIAVSADANAYDKSFAYEIAGSAAAQAGDDAKAATYFEKALASNGLDNNSHYQTMFNLAATLYGMDQNEKALAAIDRFLAETKSDKPEQLNLRGALLSNLERYDEAAKLYQDLMAKNPGEKRFLMNAVAALQQAEQFDKAAALLSAAQARGELTEPNQYRALYITYINADKDAEAVKVIDDGLAKGVLTPSPELAKDYMVLGQKAYYAEDDTTAVEMYKRAATMAADGEAALNLAKIYAQQGKAAEAKAAARQALDKGVKDEAAAKKLAGAGG